MVQTFNRLAKKCGEDGIGFSKCKEELMKPKHKKKSRRKGSRSPSRKKKRARLTKKRSIKGRRRKVPPKGVIIKQGSKYMKSDGKKMIKL